MHLCLIDIDGTLLLTGGAGQAAFSQTLALDFGIPQIVTPVAFAGRSDRAIALELMRKHGIEPSPENWRRFCAGYLSRLKAALAAHAGFVLPGAVALLQALEQRGDVALGLITGNVREGARCKLQHYDLWHWFQFGGYGDEHVDRADIAAAALAAGRQYLASRANGHSFNGQVVVIGDTPHDISCARAIGALCIAVPTGHSQAEELHRRRPDLLVESLEEIEPICALFDRG